MSDENRDYDADILDLEIRMEHSDQSPLIQEVIRNMIPGNVRLRKASMEEDGTVTIESTVTLVHKLEYIRMELSFGEGLPSVEGGNSRGET